MNNAYQEHLLEIAKCEHFLNCEDTPCKTIVESQKTGDRQLPEPWNGDLQNATILFISSNPSVHPDEHFPTLEWNEESIIDFFHHRFSMDKKYVKDYLYPLLRNKQYFPKKKWVRYWASIRKFSAKLLDKAVVPGIDYAITEIVRCKSKQELGVKEAIAACSDKFLEKTINLSNAGYLIAVGALAKKAIQEKFKIEIPKNSYCKIEIGNVPRIISAINHPNSRGKKNFEAIINNLKNGKSSPTSRISGMQSLT